MKEKENSALDDEAAFEKELPKKRHLNVVFIGHVGTLIRFMAFLKDKMLVIWSILSFGCFIFDWLIDVAIVDMCVVCSRDTHCSYLDK